MTAHGTMNIVLAATTSNVSLLGKALLTSIIGMGIVFIVLIVISFIISLLKYIPKFLENFSTRNKQNRNIDNINNESAINHIDSQEGSMESVDLSVKENGELVAVITAAIMASMESEAPVDGLIVRSIRKVTRSR